MPEERVTVSIKGVYNREDPFGHNDYVVLEDSDGRQLTIFLGQFEAVSLAAGVRADIYDRPRTYEALVTGWTLAGASVEEVEITDLAAETYEAILQLRVGDTVHPMKMRPSDALNVAARSRCPISVREHLLKPAPPPEAVTVVTILAEPRAHDVVGSPAEVSEELAQMYAEDQSDRSTEQIDWNVIGPRDAARLARVKELYQSEALSTGMDFYHAAMILQHAHDPDDHLLAHELCVVAISKGVEQAKWLAAASEDRFLMNIGQPQRFGTQFCSDGPSSDWYLYDVSPAMTDAVRLALGVPPLAEAEARAASMNAEPDPPADVS